MFLTLTVLNDSFIPYQRVFNIPFFFFFYSDEPVLILFSQSDEIRC